MVKTIYNAGPVRDFMVDVIKVDLMAGLTTLHEGMGTFSHLKSLWRAYQSIKKLPEPTKGNTVHPNTHILIEVRDHFFSHLNMPSREKALKVIFNFFIIIYEYDYMYRDMINQLKANVDTKTWLEREPKMLKVHGYWRD